MEAASPQLRRPQRTPRTPPHDSMRYSPPHRGTGNGGKAVLPREHSLDTWGAGRTPNRRWAGAGSLGDLPQH